MVSIDFVVLELIYFDFMGIIMKIIEMFFKVIVLVFFVFEECLD